MGWDGMDEVMDDGMDGWMEEGMDGDGWGWTWDGQSDGVG